MSVEVREPQAAAVDDAQGQTFGLLDLHGLQTSRAERDGDALAPQVVHLRLVDLPLQPSEDLFHRVPPTVTF